MVCTESGELMERWNADPAHEGWMQEGAQMAHDADAGGAAGVGVDEEENEYKAMACEAAAQGRGAGDARCEAHPAA